MKLEIRGFRIVESSFMNKLAPNTKIELANSFSYNVKYAKEANECVGELSVKVADKNSKNFFVKLVVEGAFHYEQADKQEDIHRATFREIYAHARAVVIMMTANAGIPPINLPYVDINTQSIYKVSDKEQ